MMDFLKRIWQRFNPWPSGPRTEPPDPSEMRQRWQAGRKEGEDAPDQNPPEPEEPMPQFGKQGPLKEVENAPEEPTPQERAVTERSRQRTASRKRRLGKPIPSPPQPEPESVLEPPGGPQRPLDAWPLAPVEVGGQLQSPAEQQPLKPIELPPQPKPEQVPPEPPKAQFPGKPEQWKPSPDPFGPTIPLKPEQSDGPGPQQIPLSPEPADEIDWSKWPKTQIKPGFPQGPPPVLPEPPRSGVPQTEMSEKGPPEQASSVADEPKPFEEPSTARPEKPARQWKRVPSAIEIPLSTPEDVARMLGKSPVDTSLADLTEHPQRGPDDWPQGERRSETGGKTAFDKPDGQTTGPEILEAIRRLNEKLESLIRTVDSIETDVTEILLEIPSAGAVGP